MYLWFAVLTATKEATKAFQRRHCMYAATKIWWLWDFSKVSFMAFNFSFFFVSFAVDLFLLFYSIIHFTFVITVDTRICRIKNCIWQKILFKQFWQIIRMYVEVLYVSDYDYVLWGHAEIVEKKLEFAILAF